MGKVYAIRCERFIKIGFTSKTAAYRLANMQVGNPFELHLVHEIDGDLKAEAELHRLFARRIVRGEWFDLTDAEAIKAMNDVARGTARPSWLSVVDALLEAA